MENNYVRCQDSISHPSNMSNTIMMYMYRHQLHDSTLLCNSCLRKRVLNGLVLLPDQKSLALAGRLTPPGQIKSRPSIEVWAYVLPVLLFLQWNRLHSEKSLWSRMEHCRGRDGVSWGQDMLQLKCQHHYPKELTDLSPLEERLISLYQPCGWITKFQIDFDKGMISGRYRRLKKGM